MIPYNHGKWGIAFIFQLRGSVFPKALAWAFPAGLVAAAIQYGLGQSGTEPVDGSTILTAYGSYITVLGFMVVFRSNQAWARFWEGASLVQHVRGEWYNATSNVFAFCTRKPEMREEVRQFQADIVRLMSLMFGSALESLAGPACVLAVMDQTGLPDEAKAFFQSCNEGSPRHEVRCEVVLQWVQRLIVLKIDSGVIDVPHPIASRVFQELSRGIVALSSARKINDLPFPFHYAQMLTVMLIGFTLGFSAAAASVMHTPWGAFAVTSINVGALWGVNYLAAEIEQPFGSDCNCLPVSHEMEQMTAMLRILLHQQTQVPPDYIRPAGDPAEPDSQLMNSVVLPCGILVRQWTPMPEGAGIISPTVRITSGFRSQFLRCSESAVTVSQKQRGARARASRFLRDAFAQRRQGRASAQCDSMNSEGSNTGSGRDGERIDDSLALEQGGDRASTAGQYRSCDDAAPQKDVLDEVLEDSVREVV